MTTDRIRQMVRAILLNDWDPIGIAGVPQAADEYDRYVADVAQMVVAGSSISDLSKHLVRIEIETMGLNGDHDRARSVAGKLRNVARGTSAST
jgi:hypothetical protein